MWSKRNRAITALLILEPRNLPTSRTGLEAFERVVDKFQARKRLLLKKKLKRRIIILRCLVVLVGCW